MLYMSRVYLGGVTRIVLEDCLPMDITHCQVDIADEGSHLYCPDPWTIGDGDRHPILLPL